MSDAWVHPFLTALAKTGIVTEACAAAGITSGAVYGKKKADGDFREAWKQALDDAQDPVESALRRRAIGYEELVVYQGQLTPVWARGADGQVITEQYTVPVFKDGQQIGTETAMRPVQERHADGSLRWLTVTKHSDVAALGLLKARRKQAFADRTEITGADGADLKVQDSTARAARVAFLMSQAKGRKEGEGLA